MAWPVSTPPFRVSRLHQEEHVTASVVCGKDGRWTIVELSEFGGSILVMFMDANRWLLVRNSATNISSYPCANHGAGIFTIIYQRLPHKSPSFVGQYTSTWLRIWDRQAPGPALGSFMASSSHLAAERGSWTLRISVPTTGSPTSCEHQSLCERSQSPAPKKREGESNESQIFKAF